MKASQALAGLGLAMLVATATGGTYDDTPLVDVLGLVPPAQGASPPTIGSGFVTADVPAHDVLVLSPVPREPGGYSRFKRAC